MSSGKGLFINIVAAMVVVIEFDVMLEFFLLKAIMSISILEEVAAKLQTNSS